MNKLFTSRQLRTQWQGFLAKKLLSWQKYSTYGFYRRTEDFVQWLVFDQSTYEHTLRVHCAMQTLAEQFPTPDLTLGKIIRDHKGGELRISSQLTSKDIEYIIAEIINQVQPSVIAPLSTEGVAELLNKYDGVHTSAFVARGVIDIIRGDNNNGRHSFMIALEKYHQIDAMWARPLEKHIQEWLSLDDEELFNQIRHDGQIGVNILRLK